MARFVRGSRRFIPIVLLGALISVVLSLPGQRAYSATSNPTQTCATLGAAGDDVSGSSEGVHTVFVGDPATLVVTNTNTAFETVVLTPDDGSIQTAALGPYGSHTFQLPAPGALLNALHPFLWNQGRWSSV